MNKKKKIGIILIVIVLSLLCIVGILYKQGIFLNFNDKENNLNNENNTNNENNSNNETTSNYKLVKILDYAEEENNKNGTSITETKKYYILESYINNKKVVYDKKDGQNITKKLFGTDEIDYISETLVNNGKDVIYIVRTKENKHGLYDENFNEIIKIGNYVIDKMGEDDYFSVGTALKEPILLDTVENVGIYDKTGKVIIPREYERLYLGGSYTGGTYYDNNKTIFYARKNNKYGIIDDKNNIIIPFEYDRANSKMSLGLGEVFKYNNETYYTLYKNGKWGMVNNKNEIIINFDKENLSYNKYANALIEKIYNDSNITKLKVYNLTGELKKEIELNNKLQVTFDAYHYSIGMINLLLEDNDYIYILNNKFEYDKYNKSASIGYGMNTDLYLAGDKIYLKESNEKYKIYNNDNNSPYMEEEFYLANTQYITDINGFILCKNKNEDNNYSKCGIIGFDGKTILDFNYEISTYDTLKSNNELISFEYNEDKKTHEIQKNKVNNNCLINGKEYFITDNIIKIDSSLYDLNCSKIADDLTNYYKLNEELIITEKFEDAIHNTYKIYNIKSKELINFENEEGTITNYIRSTSLDDSPIIITNKGTYKIVKD